MISSLKILSTLVCFLLFATQVWSMQHWNEARGVFDDVCYLRQAHLFQRFGLAGFEPAAALSHADTVDERLVGQAANARYDIQQHESARPDGQAFLR